MTANKSQLNFYTGVNYMKRSPASGSQSFALPATNTSATHAISHGLGKIPFFNVFADIYQNGQVWAVNPVWVGMDQGSTTTLPMTVASYADVNNIYLVINNNTATGNVTIWYVIYEDY